MKNRCQGQLTEADTDGREKTNRRDETDNHLQPDDRERMAILRVVSDTDTYNHMQTQKTVSPTDNYTVNHNQDETNNHAIMQKEKYPGSPW